MRRFAFAVSALLVLLILVAPTLNGADIKKGSTIAFNRGGDIWLMEADGSNQRPWVAGLSNVYGKMSWAPDNSKLVFARRGQVVVSYPDGGQHQHRAYDLFYAYPDSADNWWEGITTTLGALSPEFSDDGSKVIFIHDLAGADANAVLPIRRIALWDTETFAIDDLLFDPGSDMMATTPTLSPDGERVAFVLTRLQGQQFAQLGIVIADTAEFPVGDNELAQRASQLSDAISPSWSPDGNWIAYVSSDMANPSLSVVKPDLSVKKAVWTPPPGLGLTGAPPSWSSDSKQLLCATVNGAIYKVDLATGEAVRLSGPGNDNNPAWCN
jgi:Tol biopolymer transport system component